MWTASRETFPSATVATSISKTSHLRIDWKYRIQRYEELRISPYRYGILHLGGSDMHDLRARCAAASRLLGWPLPYAPQAAEASGDRPLPLREFALEVSR
jgi:hypothetical protein